MSKKINDLPLVTPTIEDTYVVYDQSTGNAARVAATPEERMIDLNAGGWLLDKNGAEIVSKDGKPIVFGDVVPKPLSSERAQVGLFNGVQQDIVQEFGQLSNPSNSWDQSNIVVGGMIFRWSAAATNTGILQWRRAADTSAPTTMNGSAFYVKYPNSTATTIDTRWHNTNVFARDWQGFDLILMDANYRMMTIDIISNTTGSQGHSWAIKILNGGYSNLVVTINYVGPKYVSLRGN